MDRKKRNRTVPINRIKVDEIQYIKSKTRVKKQHIGTKTVPKKT